MPSGSRAVVVTGASSGIGRAACEACVAAGWEVWAGVRREDDAPAGTTPLVMDVADDASVEAAAETLGDRRLRGIVNNAGICVPGPMALLPTDALRRQLEVNVLGVHRVTRALLPRVGRGGRVVNVSSVSGKIAFPLLGAYAASKFALEAMSEALRVEVAGEGVRVVVVAPGSVKTAIWAKSAGFDRSPYEGTRYERPLEKLAALAARSEAGGLAAEVVGRTILRALTAERPRRRYAPVPGKILNWTVPRLLPGWVWEEAARRALFGAGGGHGR